MVSVGDFDRLIPGLKLMLANSQYVSTFDNLRVRKISTSKHLQVRKKKKKKILVAKLCKWTKKLTSIPVIEVYELMFPALARERTRIELNNSILIVKLTGYVQFSIS